MEKKILEEIERELAGVETQIMELKDSFVEKFTGEYTEETTRIEAEKIALQESQEQLIAMKIPLAVMCDGGFQKNAERIGQEAVQAAQATGANKERENSINQSTTPRYA